MSLICLSAVYWKFSSSCCCFLSSQLAICKRPMLATLGCLARSSLPKSQHITPTLPNIVWEIPQNSPNDLQNRLRLCTYHQPPPFLHPCPEAIPSQEMSTYKNRCCCWHEQLETIPADRATSIFVFFYSSTMCGTIIHLCPSVPLNVITVVEAMLAWQCNLPSFQASELLDRFVV